MDFSKGKFATVFLIVAACIGIILGFSFLVVGYSKQRIQEDGKKTIAKIHLSDKKKFVDREVLVLSSYSQSYPPTVAEIEGISDVLCENGYSFEVCYLDSKTYVSRENEQLFYEQIKYKLSIHKKFDAIILLDDPVFRFAKNHYEELFSDVPVLFMGVSDLYLASVFTEEENVSGIIQVDTIEDTIRLATSLNPDTRNIVALTDGTATGQAYNSLFMSQQKYFPNKDLRIINASQFQQEDLGTMLSAIPDNSIFLFLSFIVDGSNNIYSAIEAEKFVFAHLGNVPVYRLNFGEISNGVLGGKVYDFYEGGKGAAQLAVDALEGRINLSNAGFLDNVDGKYFIDYQVFKKFGYDFSRLPEDVVFLNRDISYFEANFYIIVPFMIISASLFALIIILCISYIRATRAQIQVMLRNKAIDRKNKMLRESEQKMRTLSEKDFLTGLPNRLLASEVITQAIEAGEKFAVIQMDIDGFKNFNDYYTHDCGDFVLKEFSRRLRDISQKYGCFVARYGGDEFLLLYKGDDFTENGEVYNYIKETLNQPFVYKTMKLDLSANCGVAFYEEGTTKAQILSNADIAMYAAKAKGKGHCVFFADEMRDEINQKNEIARIIDEECKSNGFAIKYQPQIDAGSGEIYGFEALVRLEKKQISPGVFIPVAEEGGYITKIGRIVTEKVIEQMAQWRMEGYDLKKVAINYSSGQLVDSEYVEFLASLLGKYNISPSLVDIEITESLFVGNNKLARMLFDSLAKIGVGLVLDDFGTGYSSLSYLTYLPVGKVKIDKSLVDNYLVDGKDSFIKNIVHLVHDLGMELTVEGVEQKWQYERLRELNCDYIQGYYFSKPISGEEVKTFSAAV